MTAEAHEEDCLTVIFEVNNEIYSWNKQWEEAIRQKEKIIADAVDCGLSSPRSLPFASAFSLDEDTESRGRLVDLHMSMSKESIITQSKGVSESEFDSHTLPQLIKLKLKAVENPVTKKSNNGQELPMTWSKNLLRKVQAKEKDDRANGMDEHTILATGVARQREAERELWEAYTVKDKISNWEKRATHFSDTNPLTKSTASSAKLHPTVERLKTERRSSAVAGQRRNSASSPSLSLKSVSAKEAML
jgi:hypothetical protein